MTRARKAGSLPTDRAIDRRRAPRRTPADDEPVSQVRLRAGGQLTVINLSDTGLLAEGGMRLLPGTHVDVHLVTCEGRLLVRSRVVRAFVCRLGRDRIEYRGALAFERPVPTNAVGYSIPEPGNASSGTPGKPYPESPVEVLPVSAAVLSH